MGFRATEVLSPTHGWGCRQDLTSTPGFEAVYRVRLYGIADWSLQVIEPQGRQTWALGRISRVDRQMRQVVR